MLARERSAKEGPGVPRRGADSLGVPRLLARERRAAEALGVSPRVVGRWRSEGVRSGERETSRSASNQLEMTAETRDELSSAFLPTGETPLTGLHNKRRGLREL